MKGSVIALDQFQGREAAARMVDGRLVDLLIAADDDTLAPETLCRGKLGRPVKGLGGAFVDLPGGQSGFLRQTKGLRPGMSLLVQVTGWAESGKALPLGTRLMFKSRYAIITPDAPGLNVSRQIDDPARHAELSQLAQDAMSGADPALGLILRSACEGADDDDILADIAQMRDLAEAVLVDTEGAPEILVDAPSPHLAAWRDWPEPDTLDDTTGSFSRHDVTEAIELLLQPETGLPNGASMVIEPTRALIAVDVNTGPDTSPAAGLKANIACVRDLPRQLRLRGIGGQIVIDFAPFPKKERQILEQSLRAAFRNDGRDVSLAGWTPLGNFELTRKRDRMPLKLMLR
ncbi:ribonuclease E/G [Roseinatronobacter bogoriensis]|uniref:Ribonuclease G n=1 Tax=Roseinatronobacter bogoriensis subsp. barguzinensis TaxID=441209 RepID=A0A2K8KBR5_9RHOB|nr:MULTISPECIES: ribonuclease E/G [Rhodobaca]ATX66426.1 ribonuclease G [Rhodobaca barguzinensis]MBB4207569.1 Ribonuclease G/E [Rhodobaca bogoriensis DSM 18756]TDW40124.1 Rne/Rng family ribonuclease [Rhodobaca barguzinensis]TDY70724.1 Rne/Rng family ribonuclease [Rhodobaca bogoriensis DSM 18756]